MQLNWTPRTRLSEKDITYIPAQAGVYRLAYYDEKKDKYFVYFVGQAENLYEAIQKHFPEREINPCCQKYLKSHLCFARAAIVPESEVRDGVEVALFQHFMPPCIGQIPNVHPVDVNFG